jgi:hypothetical protein
MRTSNTHEGTFQALEIKFDSRLCNHLTGHADQWYIYHDSSGIEICLEIDFIHSEGIVDAAVRYVETFPSVGTC